MTVHIEKIKVCHVTTRHKPFDTRIFFKECSSLAKKYDVTLVVAWAQNTERNGVHIVGADIRFNRIMRRHEVSSLIPLLIKIDAAIYHFHDPALLPLGIKMKRKNGKKVVFDSHENRPGQLLRDLHYSPLIKKMIISLYTHYEKKSMKEYDALVSVTPTLTNRLASYNKNTYQITNYPIEEDFIDHRRWDRSICFAGSILPQWMHNNIISVLDKVNVRFKIVGHYYDKAYFDSLQSLPNWSLVDHMGSVPHENVVELLQQSSVGMALISYNANVFYHIGTLGNTKLFEYMQAGIPVIATDFQLWKEIIDEYHCGICINPNNQNEIIDAINYIVNHPEEAKLMGENGRRAVKEKFNWGTQERVLFDMYDKLLNMENQ